MSSSDLIRWGGLAAVMTGVVFIVDGLLGLAFPGAIWLEATFSAALLLMLVGLAGFHALQKESYGRIGRAGFYTIIVGSLIHVLGSMVILAGSMALDLLIVLGNLAALVGFVLYGAATLQARALPRWCGVAFIVALPVTIVLGNVVFGLVWLALGYVLWSRRGVASEEPSRVS